MRPIARRDLPSIALLAGLCGLLLFNIAVGATKGFDRPDGGILVRVLASPGIALGWGGVALLATALPYVLLAWTRGRRSGRMISIGGALFFAVALGALIAVFSVPPAAGGGRVGGALGAFLHGSLGTALAAVALLLIAIPSLLLSVAPLVLENGVGRVVEHAKETAAGTASPRPWYPERHVGDDGEEEPVQFTGSHDVGPIRFRDDPTTMPTPEPVAATVSLSPPPVSGPAAKKVKPIAGIRYADGGTDEAPPSPIPQTPVPLEEAISVAFPNAKRDDDRLPDGIRYAKPVDEPSPEPIAAFDDSSPAAALEETEAAPAAPPVGSPASEPLTSVAVSESEPVAVAALESAPPEPVRENAPTAASAPPAPAPVVATSAPALPAATIVAERPAASVAPESTSSEPIAAVAAVAAPVAIAPPIVPLNSPSEHTDSPSRPAPRVLIPPMTPKAAVAAALDLGSFDASAATATAVAEPPPSSGSAYRRKLASTGLIEGPPVAPAGVTIAKPARTRPRPSKPRDVHDAIRGLFSSLPLEELPPVQPVIDAPESASEPRVEAPGQTALFDPAAASKRRSIVLADPLFAPSVDAAIERGSASLVLLKRKLGVGYARAASLIEALVADGILGDMTASGSRPTLITATEWARRSKAKSA